MEIITIMTQIAGRYIYEISQIKVAGISIIAFTCAFIIIGVVFCFLVPNIRDRWFH